MRKLIVWTINSVLLAILSVNLKTIDIIVMNCPVSILNFLSDRPKFTAIYELVVKRSNGHDTSGSGTLGDFIRIVGHLDRDKVD